MTGCAAMTEAMCAISATAPTGDDDDFTASLMCCACGGGTTLAHAPTEVPGWYDRVEPRGIGSLQSRGFAPLTLPTQPDVPAGEPEYPDGSYWRLGQGWLPVLPEV